MLVEGRRDRDLAGVAQEEEAAPVAAQGVEFLGGGLGLGEAVEGRGALGQFSAEF